LLLIPAFLLLACLSYLVVPAGPDGPTGAANAREDRTPTCSVENQAVVGDPQTIIVNAGEKIQAAVDRARPGDTIEIMPGTCNEGVIVRRNNITLRGQSAENRPVLDGQGQIGNGVIAGGDNFTVENLLVRNYQANGILTNGPDGVVMRNIFAENTGEYGLFPVHSKNVLLETNVVTGASDAALYVGQSDGVVMRNNEAYSHI
jgi:pectin methylesterase-like acyl-CoA thioesterase